MSDESKQKLDAPEICAECGAYKIPGEEYHRCAFYAYYYGFSKTGDPGVDAILQAVAAAGKAYHHTEDWGDGENDGYAGRIQRAANYAASLRRT